MSSIKNRVKKNVQNQPHESEFKLGSILKETNIKASEMYNPLESNKGNKTLREVIKFMNELEVCYFGILFSRAHPDIMMNIPRLGSLNRCVEVLAMQVKAVAEFEHVSVDAVMGKIISAIYESEKEEE